MPLPSANKAEPTLALKPRGYVTRSPKQGYQWPHKWTCVQQKFKKKKKKICLNFNFWGGGYSVTENLKVLKCQDLPKFQFPEGGYSVTEN